MDDSTKNSLKTAGGILAAIVVVALLIGWIKDEFERVNEYLKTTNKKKKLMGIGGCGLKFILWITITISLIVADFQTAHSPYVSTDGTPYSLTDKIVVWVFILSLTIISSIISALYGLCTRAMFYQYRALK